MSEPGPGDDVARRTRLAAERTWLAWWRSGIAAATAALAVGGLLPELVDDPAWPYVALGCGYALVAVAVFLVAGLRKSAVDRALDEGSYAEVPQSWVVAFTIAGCALAVATLAVLVLS